MAYGNKYRSEFYSLQFAKLVQVQIAKVDYAGAVTDIRISSVKIVFNFQGHDTGIAGTGAKIVVVNTGEFTALDDLLTSFEKQFKCTIIYDGITVFKGYSICDLNEQQFISKSHITLQFTDYLGRMDQHYLTTLNDISLKKNVGAIITDMLLEIGLHTNTYINSSLFEKNMNSDAGRHLFEQLYVESNVFYNDSVNYEDAYTAINKILKPLEAYLYSAGDKWVIERWEDITRTGDWLYTPLLSADYGTACDSLKTTLNKQGNSSGATEDLFRYAEVTQKIFYNSGLQKLIIKLNDKQFDTVVFNDYDVSKLVSVDTKYPLAGSLNLNTWYYYELMEGFERGYNYRGMNSYLKWFNNTTGLTAENYGIYYSFEVQFEVSEEEPVILNISYKNSIEDALTIVDKVALRFNLRVDGGGSAYDGWSVYYDELNDGSTIPSLGDSDDYYLLFESDITTVSSKIWTHSQSINLTDRYVGSNDGTVHASIWEKLGYPTKQRFIIMFWPLRMERDHAIGSSDYWTPKINYIGDISITVTQGVITNKLTYYINQDFVKTEEVTMDLFDLNNTNFINGFMRLSEAGSATGEDEYEKTSAWVSVNNPSAIELMDIYAMTKFRYNFRTMFKLESTILYDGYIKPFTILTDDNLKDDSGNNRQFIVTNYTWDLDKGTYNISAEEAPDEDITLAGYTEGLATPTGLVVAEDSGDGTIDVSWNAATGATGYQVQRKPSWIPFILGLGVWAQSWVTVYSSSGTSFIDDLSADGTPTEGMSVCYRVRAYNTTESTAYSSEVCISYNVI